MTDFTGYPICHNGDVLICLGAADSLKLHSEPLKRHSSFFRNIFSKNEGIELSDKAKKNGVTHRWRFDLSIRGASAFGTLELVKLNDMGDPVGQIYTKGGVSAAQPRNLVVEQYHLMFDAVYSRPLKIPGETMGELLASLSGLVDIAEYLGCVHLISRQMDSMLIEFGQTLWVGIATRPTDWADLAIRIKSNNIIREVVIHLVGQWMNLSEEKKGGLPQKLRVLCQQKHDGLDEKKKTVEMHLVGFYSTKLERRGDADSKDLSRSSYGNDIVSWLAITVFRQWLASCFVHEFGRKAADGGYTFYALIAHGGDSYLDKDDMAKFHSKFSMSTRGENNLKSHIDALKEDVKYLVAPLMKNKSHLDVHEHPADYLTCTEVTKHDIETLWGDGVTLDWQRPVVGSIDENYGDVAFTSQTLKNGAPRDDSRPLPGKKRASNGATASKKRKLNGE